MNATSRPALTPIKPSSLNIQPSLTKSAFTPKPQHAPTTHTRQLGTPFIQKSVSTKDRAKMVKKRLQRALASLQPSSETPSTVVSTARTTTAPVASAVAPGARTPYNNKIIHGEMMALASSTPLPPSGLFTRQLSADKRSVSFLDDAPLLSSAETKGYTHSRFSTFVKNKVQLSPVTEVPSSRAQIALVFFLEAASPNEAQACPRASTSRSRVSPPLAQRGFSLITPVTSTPETFDMPRLQLPSFAEIAQRFENNLSHYRNGQLPTPFTEHKRSLPTPMGEFKTSLPSLATQFGSGYSLKTPAPRLPLLSKTATELQGPAPQSVGTYAPHQMVTPVKKRCLPADNSDDTIGESMLMSSPTRLLTTPSSMGAAKSLMQLAFPGHRP